LRPSFFQRLDLFLRKQTPFSICLILLILSLIPLPISGSFYIKPMLTIPCIFYWAIYRPEIMGLGSVYLIGLIQDILGEAPLGVDTLLFVAMYLFIISQRRFFINRPFSFIWFGFIIVSSVFCLGQWLLVSINYGQFISFAPLFYRYIILISLFPAINLLCAKIDNQILRDL